MEENKKKLDFFIEKLKERTTTEGPLFLSWQKEMKNKKRKDLELLLNLSVPHGHVEICKRNSW